MWRFGWLIVCLSLASFAFAGVVTPLSSPATPVAHATLQPMHYVQRQIGAAQAGCHDPAPPAAATHGVDHCCDSPVCSMHQALPFATAGLLLQPLTSVISAQLPRLLASRDSRPPLPPPRSTV